MTHRRIRMGILLGLLLVLRAPQSRAVTITDVDTVPPESKQVGAFELRFGVYTPQVDDEPSLHGATPYKDTFGNGSLFIFELEVDWQFWRWPGGTLGIGGSAGYFQAYAKAKSASGETSGDYTVLNVVPFRMPFVVRIDWFARELGVPLVPYGKIGLDYYVWWILDAGDIASWNGHDGEGGTFGWHGGGGLMILLDPIDPYAARTFDNEVGVNNSYLFFEYYYADISNFGASDAMYLGDNTWVAGLALEF